MTFNSLCVSIVCLRLLFWSSHAISIDIQQNTCSFENLGTSDNCKKQRNNKVKTERFFTKKLIKRNKQNEGFSNRNETQWK